MVANSWLATWMPTLEGPAVARRCSAALVAWTESVRSAVGRILVLETYSQYMRRNSGVTAIRLTWVGVR